MGKGEIIKQLLLVVPRVSKSSDCFREYLNSGSKNSWDEFTINWIVLMLNLSNIIDNDLLEGLDKKRVLQCLSLDDHLISGGDFDPHNRLAQEGVLKILWEIKKIIYSLTLKFLKESDSFTGMGIEGQEVYSFLQNLK